MGKTRNKTNNNTNEVKMGLIKITTKLERPGKKTIEVGFQIEEEHLDLLHFEKYNLEEHLERYGKKIIYDIKRRIKEEQENAKTTQE